MNRAVQIINDMRRFCLCYFPNTFARFASVFDALPTTSLADECGFSSPRLMRAASLRSTIVMMF